MKIDTAGTYTLRYSAEDDCGNVGTHDRTLTVVPPRTVLYTDGTFIINEQPQDRATNEALHGVATNEYIPFDPNGSTNVNKYIFTTYSQRPWDAQSLSITSVQIGASISPTSTAHWFVNFKNLVNVNVSNLNTSLVTSMSFMFSWCSSIASLDLTNFNTSNVQNMSDMFSYCSGLTGLNLTSFDTSRVTTMANMFAQCSNLSNINITNFNTSNVTTMASMFFGCSKLSNLDLSGFNTTSVGNMYQLFSSCSGLISLDLTSFNTQNVTRMDAMFQDCSNLITLDLTSFNTQRVTKMQSMFRYCKKLTTIYASSSFITSSVSTSSSMFSDMTSSLVGGSGTVWSSSNPKDKTYAHIDGGTSDPGYFTLKPTT